jgi:type IV pilus assembly protein PilM
LEFLNSLLSRQPASLMGVDISASSIKVVELGRTRTGDLILERCAMEPLEKGWVVDGNVEKFDEVADALRRVIRKSGSKTKSAALALPASAVITRRILLPAELSGDEMETQVESEANQYIPFSLDEVSLDYCVIGPSLSSPSDVEVLIAASRKEKVQDRQGLAEAAGLKPIIIDIESYASRLAADRLIKLTPSAGKDALIALVEIGSATTAMQVVLNGDVVYERDQAFGGGQLSQMIARQYGFSVEEAESKKRNNDLPEDYETVVLPQFRLNLAQEIMRALQFFFTSTPNSKVDNILLAGGAAGILGLSEEIHEQSGFACSVANPFEGMDISANLRANKINKESTSYLTATGLALRRYLA